MSLLSDSRYCAKLFAYSSISHLLPSLIHKSSPERSEDDCTVPSVGFSQDSSSRAECVWIRVL